MQTSIRKTSWLRLVMISARKSLPWIALFAFVAMVWMSQSAHAQTVDGAASGKKIVFLAGRPSHGYGSHEHYAGCRLLAAKLQESLPGVKCEVFQQGWPDDDSILSDADSVVIYCDGGGGHLVIPHKEKMQKLIDRGIGFVCLHYAVEVPKGEMGELFLNWLGGYFETDWSVNPHWVASFQEFVDHPITNGVSPVSADDEWYFHMRFRPNMSGVTPILSSTPPAETMSRPDGAHSGNPHVRKVVAAGEAQHVAWAFERPDGGRSFGYTGGHYHWNWGRPELMKVVTNAIAWTAKIDIPEKGLATSPTPLQKLTEGQDEPIPANLNEAKIAEQFKLTKLSGRKKNNTAAQSNQGRRLYASPVITSQTPGQKIDINVQLDGAKTVFLVADDGGDGFTCDWAAWLNPVLSGPKGKLDLTKQKWGRATAQWGQVQLGRNAAGGAIVVAGQRYETAIGTHANSIIEFSVPDGYDQLTVTGGLDAGGVNQNDGTATSIRFMIFADGVPNQIGSNSQEGNQQREPENAIAGLTSHPDVEVTLAASEPELCSLTNLDIDARGRVWVCEVVNYRGNNGKRPDGDRILILEDTDQDGVMDSQKVFYQGHEVDSAMGICVLGNRVIVSASPDIWVFTDENGDDQPDSKHKLFSNTGQPQHDHSAHSMLFGPDGKLYWNFGNTGKAVHDAEGKPVIDKAGNAVIDNGKPYYGGMVFRCNLDGSEFEVLGHNFRNNYEVTVDSFGTLWQSDNDDDGNRGVRINYVMEYGNYGYRDELTGAGWQVERTNWEKDIPSRHWHLNDPGVVPTMLLTGAGSPTGITVYEGRMLPEVFWDQVIHCDAGPNVVRGYPAQKQGAGFTAEMVNLITGENDNWFRPADVCVAPDGSLYITDWYDPGVGGHRQEDLERGRLFRVAPPNTPYKTPEYDFTTAAGAAEALRSPAASVRYLAWQKLSELGDQAEAALKKLWSDDNPRIRARALWLLGRLSAEKSQLYISAAMKDSNSDIRITAIRLARELGIPRTAYVPEMIADNDPQVRRELLVSLRFDDSAEMPKLWAKLAVQHTGQDRWYLEALGIGADLRWDDCLAAYLDVAGPTINTPAGKDIIWRSRAKQTPELITQVISDINLPETEVQRFLRAFDYFEDSTREKALKQLLQSQAEE